MLGILSLYVYKNCLGYHRWRLQWRPIVLPSGLIKRWKWTSQSTRHTGLICAESRFPLICENIYILHLTLKINHFFKKDCCDVQWYVTTNQFRPNINIKCIIHSYEFKPPWQPYVNSWIFKPNHTLAHKSALIHCGMNKWKR